MFAFSRVQPRASLSQPTQREAPSLLPQAVRGAPQEARRPFPKTGVRPGTNVPPNTPILLAPNPAQTYPEGRESSVRHRRVQSFRVSEPQPVTPEPATPLRSRLRSTGRKRRVTR